MTKLQKEAMREQARYHDADTRAQVLVRSLDMHARVCVCVRERERERERERKRERERERERERLV
jgi:hypothetical protein